MDLFIDLKVLEKKWRSIFWNWQDSFRKTDQIFSKPSWKQFWRLVIQLNKNTVCCIFATKSLKAVKGRFSENKWMEKYHSKQGAKKKGFAVSDGAAQQIEFPKYPQKWK